MILVLMLRPSKRKRIASSWVAMRLRKLIGRGQTASASWSFRKGSQKLYRGAIPDCATAVEYLEKVDIQFIGSSKVYVSTLIKRLTTEKYSGGGVRDHILRMSNVVVRLKPPNLTMKDGFLIYLIFNSLLKEFETFEVNYNSMNEKWTLEKFMAMCVQEEERIKRNSGGVDNVNLVKHNNKKRNFVPKPAPKNEEKGMGAARPPVEKDQCKWCFKRGHY
jgi:hypothetical protein